MNGWLTRRATRRQQIERMTDALRLIDRHGCESFTNGRCLDPGSGVIRGAQFGVYAWCDPCIAADALREGK